MNRLSIEEITIKEIKLGIILFLVVLALSILFEPVITDPLEQRAYVYETALHVRTPSNFVWAKQSNSGVVLAYGDVSANDPKSFFYELTGKYSAIKKVTEKYTQKSRQVCDARDDDGNCTSWRTEIYYEWDHYKSETKTSRSIHFLGENFNYSDFPMPSPYMSVNVLKEARGWNRGQSVYIYERESGNRVGDYRWKYYSVPSTIRGTVMFHFSTEYQPPPILYLDEEPEIVVRDAVLAVNNSKYLYYSAVVLLFLSVYFLLAATVLDIR